MRILLDENLDWRLRRELSDHTVESVPLIGWAGLTNGELLARAEGRFDVLVTMDTGLPHQRNPSTHRIAILVLRASSNRFSETRPLMPRVLALLETIVPGSVTTVSL